MGNKAVIYARASSTGDRQDTSRQVADLTAYAEREGIPFDVVEVALDKETVNSLEDAGTLIRLGDGVFYRPKISEYGLGPLPVSEKDIIDYVTRKYDGYISGPYAYNLFGLTTQTAVIITIATPHPVEPLTLGQYGFVFKKSVFGYQEGRRNTDLLVLLDAASEPTGVPGMSTEEVMTVVRKKISQLSEEKASEFQRLLLSYDNLKL